MRIHDVYSWRLQRIALTLALIPAACCAGGFQLQVRTFQHAGTDTDPVEFTHNGTHGPLSLHPPMVDGICERDGETFYVSASASADANDGDVSASVETTGARCSVAWAISTYTDTVTLHPPAGSSNAGVTFSVAVNHTLRLKAAPGEAQRTVYAYVQQEIPEFDSNVYDYQEADGASTGSVTFSGLINSKQFTFLICPCVFTLTIRAAASAMWGASASAHDPFTVNLPPGWTYTLASRGPSLAGARFVPVTPCRIADTRNPAGAFGGPAIAGNTSRSFPVPQSGCRIPSTATAYSLNVTAVPRGPLGYLTIWPSDQEQPYVSTLNSFDGRIKANAAIVPAAVNGAVSVFATDTTDVILDINGYFVPATGNENLAFYPFAPCRVVDTRNANGPFGGPRMSGGEVRNFNLPQSACGLPPNAQAYSLNFTVVPPGPLSYLTTWPAGQSQPLASTLNSFNGAVVANAAIVPAANGAISVFVTNPTDVVLDVNGYFAPPGATGALSFYAVTPCRVSDTRSAVGAFGGPALNAGQTRGLPVPASACDTPATARAYSLNATVVPPAQLGYLTLWPEGGNQPFVSTLNSFDGSVTSNAAIVPAGPSGAINAYATHATHLIVDINGFFAP